MHASIPAFRGFLLPCALPDAFHLTGSMDCGFRLSPVLLAVYPISQLAAWLFLSLVVMPLILLCNLTPAGDLYECGKNNAAYLEQRLPELHILWQLLLIVACQSF